MAHTVNVQIPSLNKQITVPTGLFIDNEFVPSFDSSEMITYARVLCCKVTFIDAEFRAINPATEEIICSVVSGNAILQVGCLTFMPCSLP